MQLEKHILYSDTSLLIRRDQLEAHRIQAIIRIPQSPFAPGALTYLPACGRRADEEMRRTSLTDFKASLLACLLDTVVGSLYSAWVRGAHWRTASYCLLVASPREPSTNFHSSFSLRQLPSKRQHVNPPIVSHSPFDYNNPKFSVLSCLGSSGLLSACLGKINSSALLCLDSSFGSTVSRLACQRQPARPPTTWSADRS